MMKSLKRLMVLLSFCSFVGLTACNKSGDSIRSYFNIPGTITFQQINQQTSMCILTDDNTLVYVNSGLSSSTFLPGDRIIADLNVDKDRQPASGEYLIADIIGYLPLPTEACKILIDSQTFDDFGMDPISYMSERSFLYGNGFLTVLPLVNAQNYDQVGSYRFSLIFDRDSYDAINNPYNYTFEFRLDKDGENTGSGEFVAYRSFSLDKTLFPPTEDLTFNIRYKTNDRILDGPVKTETVVYKYTAPK